MFEILFVDLDDTILDFKKAEKVALEKTLRGFGLEPTAAVCQRYHEINKAYWEALERKEVTREQVLVGRFETLFGEMQIAVDPVSVAEGYKSNLGIGHYFLPGAEDAVKSLSKKYRLFLASNGTTTVQQGRIASADIAGYFENIFISQEIGINKPDKGYFDRCFSEIPNFDLAKTIIVGDSLTSDMLGGQNAGIATCWVNPNRKQRREDIRVDYEIESLSQLEDLLEGLK